MTARTVRFYQSVDVLPKPDRGDRAAVYHEKHLEGLRLLAELQDRGLGLSAIDCTDQPSPAMAGRPD